MGDRCKINTGEFTNYLQSVVKLDALEKMTQDLDRELEDSQRIMGEIKAMYESVSVGQNNQTEPVNNGLRHEDISKFLEAGVPKLVMPDMAENTMDVDIDDVITTMKKYAEELKKNYSVSETQISKPNEMVKLEMDQYVQSLNQLNQRLSSVPLNKKYGDKSPELEEKISALCHNVNLFTKLVQVRSSQGPEVTQSWSVAERKTVAFMFDAMVERVLAAIMDVSYLLEDHAQ